VTRLLREQLQPFSGLLSCNGSITTGPPVDLYLGRLGQLLGDRRARNLGDLLTVVIEIDEEAEMRNSSSRNREGSETVHAAGG